MIAEIIGPDVLIILAIVALLFGSTRLPKLARSLGSAKTEFEKGIAEGVSATAPSTEKTVTLTQAELDAMIAEREAKGRSALRPAALPALGGTAVPDNGSQGRTE